MQPSLFTQSNEIWKKHASEISIPYSQVTSPTMTITNRCYSNRHFRRVHVEHAETSQGLQIVHHVTYPHPERDIPIFGIDLLYTSEKSIMGIIDFSLDHQRPFWTSLFESITKKHDIGGRPREIPYWGKEIFSDACIFVQEPDIDAFTSCAVDLQYAYIRHSWTAGLVDHGDHAEFHHRYSMCQRQNTKTKGMLAASFGNTWAEEYMKFMFDFEFDKN